MLNPKVGINENVALKTEIFLDLVILLHRSGIFKASQYEITWQHFTSD